MPPQNLGPHVPGKHGKWKAGGEKARDAGVGEMTSSADLIPGPFLLPLPPRGKEQALHKQSESQKKILMVDKYFITGA